MSRPVALESGLNTSSSLGKQSSLTQFEKKSSRNAIKFREHGVKNPSLIECICADLSWDARMQAQRSLSFHQGQSKSKSLFAQGITLFEDGIITYSHGQKKRTLIDEFLVAPLHSYEKIGHLFWT